MDWLRQGRQDLDALRKDVLEFHKSQAEIKKLGAELAADRQAIQEFNERMNAISTRAPEIEAKVEAVLDMMSIVENASQKATGLQELMSTLDGQVARLESRASFVEGIETRLNTLNTLSTEIDRRLEQQLERRGDFDMLKTASDGVVAQIADAHHKLEAVHALQARFVPLLDQAKVLKSDIDATRTRLEEIKPDDAVVAEHEKRFADLVSTSRALGTELADRRNDMLVARGGARSFGTTEDHAAERAGARAKPSAGDRRTHRGLRRPAGARRANVQTGRGAAPPDHDG